MTTRRHRARRRGPLRRPPLPEEVIRARLAREVAEYLIGLADLKYYRKMAGFVPVAPASLREFASGRNVYEVAARIPSLYAAGAIAPCYPRDCHACMVFDWIEAHMPDCYRYIPPGNLPCDSQHRGLGIIEGDGREFALLVIFEICWIQRVDSSVW